MPKSDAPLSILLVRITMRQLRLSGQTGYGEELPSGHRVEGLALAEVALLLEALG
jgi:hypothetical protein